MKTRTEIEKEIARLEDKIEKADYHTSRTKLHQSRIQRLSTLKWVIE